MCCGFLSDVCLRVLTVHSFSSSPTVHFTVSRFAPRFLGHRVTCVDTCVSKSMRKLPFPRLLQLFSRCQSCCLFLSQWFPNLLSTVFLSYRFDGLSFLPHTAVEHVKLHGQVLHMSLQSSGVLSKYGTSGFNFNPLIRRLGKVPRFFLTLALATGVQALHDKLLNVPTAKLYSRPFWRAGFVVDPFASKCLSESDGSFHGDAFFLSIGFIWFRVYRSSRIRAIGNRHETAHEHYPQSRDLNNQVST